MHIVVLAAEAAALILLITWCLMIASDGIRGPVFSIAAKDPVARFLIRNAQVAFVLGYTTFFASTAAIALGLL